MKFNDHEFNMVSLYNLAKIGLEDLNEMNTLEDFSAKIERNCRKIRVTNL